MQAGRQAGRRVHGVLSRSTDTAFVPVFHADHPIHLLPSQLEVFECPMTV